MSKEDSTSGGLLSKVVRFVRKPGASVADAQAPAADNEDGPYSKQVLKDMVERKRHNDLVRKREFDQLRQIRQRQTLQGQTSRQQDPAMRPSFFQSSMASPDERAVTLKKIDEIEAQMSQQWWKSKQGGIAPASGDAKTIPASMAATIPASMAATIPASMAATMPSPPGQNAFAATMPAGVPFAEASPAGPNYVPLIPDDSMQVQAFGTVDAAMSPPVMASAPPKASAAPMVSPRGWPQFITVPESPPEPEVFVHEPELEEAAIRFANGDYDGAEEGLCEVLAQYSQSNSSESLEIWMTLFDLLRATGRHSKFEPLAIEFASRYGRSAPLWFSMPEQLGLVEAAGAQEDANARKLSWSCPPNLAVSTMAALHALLQRSVPPWTLSWSRMTGVDDAAVSLLADEFTQWADRPGQFCFSGVDRLHALLESKTQPGDRSTGPEWWRLRMSAMRLMARPDDFEMVALDYCVTYEVSPPSWVSPKCGYSDDGSQAAPKPVAAPAKDWLASDYGALSVPAPLEVVPVPKLSGHIDGDATPMLEPFQSAVRPGVPIVVACDQLIRMDFAAAGSVLNWAAEQQAKGHVVHFQNLQRLVAVLLNVIGVNEHAKVIPRKN